MLATAAMKKLSTTPGPAMLRATIPATRYIPVPQHDPTPSEVRSSVVRHFVSLGLLLLGSSSWSFRRSFVRMSLENSARPVPPPGMGMENFIL
uniref:Uncharacterized protein n=1 Tax=Anopheles albimanus TaxID=7167 RepID=A0A182FZ38_ANOAL